MESWSSGQAAADETPIISSNKEQMMMQEKSNPQEPFFLVTYDGYITSTT